MGFGFGFCCCDVGDYPCTNTYSTPQSYTFGFNSPPFSLLLPDTYATLNGSDVDLTGYEFGERFWIPPYVAAANEPKPQGPKLLTVFAEITVTDIPAGTSASQGKYLTLQMSGGTDLHTTRIDIFNTSNDTSGTFKRLFQGVQYGTTTLPATIRIVYEFSLDGSNVYTYDTVAIVNGSEIRRASGWGYNDGGGDHTLSDPPCPIVFPTITYGFKSVGIVKINSPSFGYTTE